LENRRSKDDEMSRRIWETVEASIGKSRIAKIERRESKRRKRRKKRSKSRGRNRKRRRQCK